MQFFNLAVALALAASAVALPQSTTTSCVDGVCVTGKESTRVSSVNGVTSFEADGQQGLFFITLIQDPFLESMSVVL